MRVCVCVCVCMCVLTNVLDCGWNKHMNSQVLLVENGVSVEC